MPSYLYLSFEKSSDLVGLYQELLNNSPRCLLFHSPLTRPSAFPNIPSDAVDYLSSIVLQHCKFFGRSWYEQLGQKIFWCCRVMLGEIRHWVSALNLGPREAALAPGSAELSPFLYSCVSWALGNPSHGAWRAVAGSTGRWGWADFSALDVPGMCSLPD